MADTERQRHLSFERCGPALGCLSWDAISLEPHVCLIVYRTTFTPLRTFSRSAALSSKGFGDVRFPFMGAPVAVDGKLRLWIWDRGCPSMGRTGCGYGTKVDICGAEPRARTGSRLWDVLKVACYGSNFGRVLDASLGTNAGEGSLLWVSS